MEDDHMIEALAANGSNHPFDIGTLPRRARYRQNFADTHVSYVFSEVIAKNSVTVAEQEARELVKGKCFPGFSRHILRIRSRTSREMTGRPGWPCRTFQVQNKRKPA
jgi:hypothetical protein